MKWGYDRFAGQEMGATIRAAMQADLAAVTGIYRDAVLHGTASYELEPPDLAEMRRRFETIAGDGYPYIVAEEAQTVLGYAYAAPFRARPAYRFIVEDSIYVAPEAKKRGIGRALLARLIEESTGLGFRQMIAVIGDGSAGSPSVILHEKLGFTHAGSLQGSGFKHGRWLDTVFMQLPMNGGTGAPPDPQSLPERLFGGATRS
jgi:phosphinothricin acetyltransferase